MKTCPRCQKTYPDDEVFCEADGTSLVAAEKPAPAGTSEWEKGAGPTEFGAECPACGGKAEPGELICNFCGARLAQGAEPEQPKGPVWRQTAAVSGEEASGWSETGGRRGGHRALFGAAYVLAAVAALAAGAWLALRLSSTQAPPPPPAEQAKASRPSPAPAPVAPAGPMAVLGERVPVQVNGESSAAPERTGVAAKKIFVDHSSALLEKYKQALKSDSSLGDGMLVRLSITPEGKVDGGSVRTSTSSNPALDAAVVAEAMTWEFAPTRAGRAEVDYPIIFARNTSEQEKLDEDLAVKLAGMSPSEGAEYAFAPAPAAPAAPVSAPASPASAPTPGEASAGAAGGAPPPAATPVTPPTPAVAGLGSPPAGAEAVAPKPVRRRHTTKRPPPKAGPELAAIPKPRPTLLDLVRHRLRNDRELRRVKAYTDGGKVTLFGRVFDDKAKLYAERAVKEVPGVTTVVNTLSTDTAQWAEQQERVNRELHNAGLANVTAKVVGHDAYLEGEVTTELERQRAATIAQQTAPVTVRTNLIRVVPGNMFGF